jgi:CelD/BcsL family acetyltransferase involved in cellulose biosynthesis
MQYPEAHDHLSRPGRREVHQKGLDIHVVGCEADLARLEEEWERLASSARGPLGRFLLFESACAAWATVARPKGYELHILVARKEGTVVAILPLVRRRFGPLRVGHWLGPQFDESCEILHAPGLDRATLTSVWSAACARFDILHFPVIHPGARLRELAGNLRHVQRPARHPVVDCTRWGDWEAYAAGLSSSMKREYRRDLRRMREAGEVAFTAMAGTDFDLAPVLDWILERKMDWIVRTGTRPHLFSEKRAFFREFYHAIQQQGRLIVFELRVNGERVAAQVGSRMEDRLLLEISGWDEKWRKVSPGLILDFETLRWAFANGIDIIDFGVGGHAYKYKFADKDEEVVRHMTVAAQPLGYPIVAAIDVYLQLRSRMKTKGPAEERKLRAAAMGASRPAVEKRPRRSFISDPVPLLPYCCLLLEAVDFI